MGAVLSHLEGSLLLTLNQFLDQDAYTNQVAWPNMSFDPPENKKWVKPIITFGDLTQATVGDTGLNRIDAVMSINCCGPINTAMGELNDFIDRVMSWFKRGKDTAAVSSYSMRIISVSKNSPMQYGDHVCVPVKVKLYTETENI